MFNAIRDAFSDMPTVGLQEMLLLPHGRTVLRKRTSLRITQAPSKKTRPPDLIALNKQPEISASKCGDNASRESNGTTGIGWMPGVH